MATSPGHSRCESPSLSVRVRREQTLDRFEAAWRKGPRPRLLEFLSQIAAAEQPGLWQELLRLDIEYRRQAGECPLAADYADGLPGSAEEIAEILRDAARGSPHSSATECITDAARPAEEKILSAVSALIAVGSELGPYEVLEKLGEGGMGTVFKARHMHLDKLVALKVLPREFLKMKESISRFRREMKAIGKIDHPNIVRAMDAGQIGETYFLAMEFVDGISLAQAVKQQGPFSPADARGTVRQAASALSAAHGAGLVHRDVKPSNLLISANGQLKLLDLGLARLDDGSGQNTAITALGQAFGTPDFMAPEQWTDSHSADARADLYSLGCTLFFLLTGRAPYGDRQHRSAPKKMAGHLFEPIPDLKTIRDDVPDALITVYQTLMEKSPEKRFQTANEVMEALDR